MWVERCCDTSVSTWISWPTVGFRFGLYQPCLTVPTQAKHSRLNSELASKGREKNIFSKVALKGVKMCSLGRDCFVLRKVTTPVLAAKKGTGNESQPKNRLKDRMQNSGFGLLSFIHWMTTKEFMTKTHCPPNASLSSPATDSFSNFILTLKKLVILKRSDHQIDEPLLAITPTMNNHLVYT